MARPSPFARAFRLAALLALLIGALAPGGAVDAGEGGVPLPAVPRAKGERCVEDTDVMRRRHMEFLFHERDAAVREGVRGPKYGLKECIACHATPDPQVAGGAVRTARQFCSTCHAYAAVRIDCFACHSDRPAEKAESAAASTTSWPALAGAAWTPRLQGGPAP
jgi:hypothetical protein